MHVCERDAEHNGNGIIQRGSCGESGCFHGLNCKE